MRGSARERFGFSRVLNRVLASLAGFFAYVANLLAYVVVPAPISKPALAGGFGAIAAALVATAVARARFFGWQRVLAGVLIGAGLTSILAVGVIAFVRRSDAVMHTPGAQQLSAFSDYTTGGTVSAALIACGWLLAWIAWRRRTRK